MTMSGAEYDKWLADTIAEIRTPEFRAAELKVAQDLHMQNLLARRSESLSPDPNPIDLTAGVRRMDLYELIGKRGD